MKIGPLNNKQVGNQQENAQQANVRRSESGSVARSEDRSILNERKRLAELADQKQQADAAKFERSDNRSFSISGDTSAYSKKQLESSRLELVKKRIRDGFYDQKDIVLKIAGRMIERLELEDESKTE